MIADWQVAILGGGPAGCATSLALVGNGVSPICIVDPDCSLGAPVGETLPPDTRLLLDRLGLWDEFAAEGHGICLGSCSAWGSVDLGYNDFVFNRHAHGWHLDRPRFDSWLRRQAAAAGITIVSGAKPYRCEMDCRRGFRLHFRDGDRTSTTVTARYVVDATGLKAAFARQFGSRRILLDCLTFVYGYFRAQRGAQSQLTLLEATENGWWYAAGLPGHRVAVSLATDPETVHAFRLLEEEFWLKQILQTQHLAARLGECRFVPGSLKIRAAPSVLLDRAAGARWLAVGDAAAAYDPLSSQGLYKALENGIEAAEAITVAIERDAPIAPAYAASIRRNFRAHRTDCDYFYRMEQRWPGSRFWRSRLARAGLDWTESAA